MTTPTTLLLDSDAGEKVKVFVQALAELCLEHKIQLSSSGYDGLQVWDLDTTEPLYLPFIEDKTKL